MADGEQAYAEKAPQVGVGGWPLVPPPNEESGGRREGLPLAAAASKADLPIAELLIRYGADPLLPERGGNSALDWGKGWEREAEERRAGEDLLVAVSAAG
ncbi:hypothetical protein ACIGV8_11395 [Streptomyces albidoflavus]